MSTFTPLAGEAASAAAIEEELKDLPPRPPHFAIPTRTRSLRSVQSLRNVHSEERLQKLGGVGSSEDTLVEVAQHSSPTSSSSEDEDDDVPLGQLIPQTAELGVSQPAPLLEEADLDTRSHYSDDNPSDSVSLPTDTSTISAPPSDIVEDLPNEDNSPRDSLESVESGESRATLNKGMSKSVEKLTFDIRNAFRNGLEQAAEDNPDVVNEEESPATVAKVAQPIVVHTVLAGVTHEHSPEGHFEAVPAGEANEEFLQVTPDISIEHSELYSEGSTPPIPVHEIVTPVLEAPTPAAMPLGVSSENAGDASAQNIQETTEEPVLVAADIDLEATPNAARSDSLPVTKPVQAAPVSVSRGIASPPQRSVPQRTPPTTIPKATSPTGLISPTQTRPPTSSTPQSTPRAATTTEPKTLKNSISRNFFASTPRAPATTEPKTLKKKRSFFASCLPSWLTKKDTKSKTTLPTVLESQRAVPLEGGKGKGKAVDGDEREGLVGTSSGASGPSRVPMINIGTGKPRVSVSGMATPSHILRTHASVDSLAQSVRLRSQPSIDSFANSDSSPTTTEKKSIFRHQRGFSRDERRVGEEDASERKEGKEDSGPGDVVVPSKNVDPASGGASNIPEASVNIEELARSIPLPEDHIVSSSAETLVATDGAVLDTLKTRAVDDDAASMYSDASSEALTLASLDSEADVEEQSVQKAVVEEDRVEIPSAPARTETPLSFNGLRDVQIPVAVAAPASNYTMDEDTVSVNAVGTSRFADQPAAPALKLSTKRSGMVFINPDDDESTPLSALTSRGTPEPLTASSPRAPLASAPASTASSLPTLVTPTAADRYDVQSTTQSAQRSPDGSIRNESAAPSLTVPVSFDSLYHDLVISNMDFAEFADRISSKTSLATHTSSSGSTSTLDRSLSMSGMSQARIAPQHNTLSVRPSMPSLRLLNSSTTPQHATKVYALPNASSSSTSSGTTPSSTASSSLNRPTNTVNKFIARPAHILTPPHTPPASPARNGQKTEAESISDTVSATDHWRRNIARALESTATLRHASSRSTLASHARRSPEPVYSPPATTVTPAAYERGYTSPPYAVPTKRPNRPAPPPPNTAPYIPTSPTSPTSSTTAQNPPFRRPTPTRARTQDRKNAYSLHEDFVNAIEGSLMGDGEEGLADVVSFALAMSDQ
ncbi:uncharacterized protein EV422DRAFT_520596 [Fimicolochytrium jonesii]|uniref:uncharacterized protein n=1 Tax=Fimicolochytrium jonesii TaxID=1396493 RepID=UPI0022FE19DE|nr:uncharacterized protein EV422DRAFT_520596 [Fimicolochytrium jonesii]KAI8824579.1 hypothetical protein EV422DRAFT_520596 [Fimicolochytrium jonesii]